MTDHATPTGADPLREWLAWLDTPDCRCPYEWRSIGRLYEVSMGKGWVRMATDPECPNHGTNAAAGDRDG